MSDDFKYRWPSKKLEDVPKSTLAGEYYSNQSESLNPDYAIEIYYGPKLTEI